jgi:hypothetical protein
MTTSQEWDSGPTGTPNAGQHTAPGTQGVDIPSGDELGGGGAKERAQQTAETAKEEGAHVAEAAKGEAQQVMGEAKDKAADILSEARTQVDQQSRTQLHALASKLEELSGEVDSMVAGSDVQGTVTELARQLSDKTRALSSQLSQREPMDLLEDVRGFARRRPGTFLAGALAAGIVAGRLTRGAKKAHDDEATGEPISGPATTGSPLPGTAPTARDLAGSTTVGGLGGQSVPSGQNVGGRP